MLKVTSSLALLLLVAATAAAQESPAPAAATTAVQETGGPATTTTAVQETSAPVSAHETKLNATVDVEGQKVDPPAATASSLSPAERPPTKRAAATRNQSTATRGRAPVAYPGYAAPM
jgi:hypothetical protein